MPGRPRTTLKRLDALIDRAESYGSDLFDLAPPRYLENPDPNDALAIAWRRAADAAVESYRALDALRRLAAEKVARADRMRASLSDGDVGMT
jgi:hypothetical protein